jgi:DNA excision repair protein ERCC-2
VAEAPNSPSAQGQAPLVPSASVYTVAVRALCEFTAKRGDLDLRFTPSPTGAEGVEGHGVVTARRGVGYQTEVALSGDWGPLRVRGRADGWDPVARRLEEIKTYRGDLAHVPNNHRQLHWAQARVYGALICHQLGLQQVALALVYYNIDTRQETVFTETGEAATLLQAFFEEQCRHFAAWSAQETAHRAARDEALRALAFPMPAFRSGQRDLAEAVYRAARPGPLPAGAGAHRHWQDRGHAVPAAARHAAGCQPRRQRAGQDRSTSPAKTPGRQLALDALQSLRAGLPKAPLRVLELVARDKACEHPDKACHGESCPLARGFYDRLSAARQAAVDAAGAGLLARERVRAVALQHQVCPYYLAQELARWADAVVGDYNYWFDTSALLFALTQMDGWRVAVLVDEAHNLVERARSMYSAELEQGALRALRRSAAPVSPPLKRALDRLNRHWNALQREQRTPYAASQALAGCLRRGTEPDPGHLDRAAD